MTKISKFLLFVFCLICLFCYIGSVSALDIQPYWLQGFINQNQFSQEVTSSNKLFTKDINFIGNSQNISNNYKYIYFSINAVLKDSLSTTTQSPIDYTATCSSTQWTSSTGPSYTITYQDGSTARITGTEYDTYCSNYNLSANQSYVNNFTEIYDQYPRLEVYLIRNNAPYYTEDLCLKEDGYFKCEVQNLSYYSIRVKGQVSGKDSTYKIIMSYWGYITNASVINSINNQTTTINNNITDVNNSINSSDITGNNSSDSITSISNSFSSSNDFILNLFTLPYNFITTIMNGVTDSCTPISLGTIFDYELVMPCINLNDWLGNVWTSIVDVVLAGMLSFAFRKRIHDFFFAIIRLDRNAANIGGVEIL